MSRQLDLLLLVRLHFHVEHDGVYIQRDVAHVGLQPLELPQWLLLGILEKPENSLRKLFEVVDFLEIWMAHEFLVFCDFEERVDQALDSAYTCERVLKVVDGALELVPSLDEVRNCADLELLLCCVHDTLASWYVHLEESGLPLDETQQLLGHSLAALSPDDLYLNLSQRVALHLHSDFIESKL